jgi:hypothetical protein
MEVIEIHPFDMYLKLQTVSMENVFKNAERTDKLWEIDGKLYRQNPKVPPTPEAVKAVA